MKYIGQTRNVLGLKIYLPEREIGNKIFNTRGAFNRFPDFFGTGI